MNPRLKALIAEEKDDAIFPTADNEVADAGVGEHADADEDMGFAGETPAATAPGSNAVADTTTDAEAAVRGCNEAPPDDMIYNTSLVEDNSDGENGPSRDSGNRSATMTDDNSTDEEGGLTASPVRADAAAQDGQELATTGVQEGLSQSFIDLKSLQEEHESQTLSSNWHNAHYIDPAVLRTAGLLPPTTTSRNATNVPRLPAAAPNSTPMSFSVHNSTSLSASAKLWTSQQTTVVPNQNGSVIQVKYKHGKALPRYVSSLTG